MSMLPPPPPPSSTPPPPPGYVAYRATTGSVQPSKGLSSAMIVLFWCTTGAAAFLAYAFFHRKQVFDDVISRGLTLSDIPKLDAADKFVGLAAILQIAVAIAAAIVTCLWSRRIATNAQARGVQSVRPGWAAGGWFVPIGSFWLPWKELKRSGEGVGADISAVSRWQAFFAVQGVLGFVTRSTGNFENSDTAAEVTSALQRQWVVGLVAAAAFAVTTLAAMRASKVLDAAVSSAG